jgi:hypothetical protein
VLGRFRQHPLTRSFESQRVSDRAEFMSGQTPALLGRWICGVNRFRHRRLGLDLKSWLGRQDLGADGPGSFAGRTVTRHMGRLHLGLVPWPVVNDQHAENAKDCDRNSDHQWDTTTPARTISCQILSHLKIRVDLY